MLISSSSPWHRQQQQQPGRGGRGLLVMVECGFDTLMDSDAEIRSLATQLQVSYANCVGLVADAVMERWEERGAEEEEGRRASVLTLVAAETGGEHNAAAAATSACHRDDTERPLARDRHRAEAVRALAFAAGAAGEERCSHVSGNGKGMCVADGSEMGENEEDIAVLISKRSIRPVGLMFTSFKGRVAEAVGRDGGSANWALRTDELSFEQVAAAGGFGGLDSNPRRVIVLSPDAPEALTGAPDRDALYVIGGLCDYKRHKNATLDRAADANGHAAKASSNVAVEARRLPIEEIFGGSVSVNILTVNQAVEALVRADINGGDWAEALEVTLPSRKLR